MKCEDLMILAPYKKECFSYFMLQKNPDDKLEIRVTFEVFSNKFEYSSHELGYVWEYRKE